jgi:hypothetical protein
MAINTQKLLPPSKISSPIANFSGLSIQKKTTEVNRVSQLSQKYNQQNLNIIKSSLIDVDSLLKSVLSENKSTEEAKRRRKEREEYEERESRLEIPKEQKKFRLPAVSLPGMSFLDRIKRFLFFTALGWLFSNFQSQLPKLLGIVKIITPIYGVVENVFKFILSSVVNVIDRGYETYDKIRGLVKSVGGENAQQDFDVLSSKMNEYINYILIGGMALTGAISAFATNVSRFKPQQSTPRPTGGGPRVTTGSGGRPPSTGARVTTSGGRVAQRQIAKNFIRTSVKPALSRLPIIGGLIEFGLSWALGDPVGKAAFRGIGSLLVGAVGTAIGGPIGAAIGGLLGGEIGGKIYDVFFGGKKPAAYHKGGRIRAYAKGGSVLGDYGSGRTLEVERTKKPTPRPQSTQPGKDVGGPNEIKKLLPNTNENPLTLTKPNPYYALTGAASDFKSAPYGLGSLMGGAIDVALGQKMSNTTIMNASRGLENLFYDNYDPKTNIIDVQSIIYGAVNSAASSAFENIRSQVNKGKKKEEEKEEEPPIATGGTGQSGSELFRGGSSASLLAQTASEMKGFSSAQGPGGGREACVWAVNQVYKKAGLTPPWGSSEYVPTAEQMMIKKGYVQVSEGSRQPGDIYVAYDRKSPPQIHIGIVLANGNILSNSTSGARFSWEDTPDGYAREYGARGKFYRSPDASIQIAKAPNASSSVNKTASSMPSTSFGGGGGNKEQSALLKAISFAEGTTGGYGIIFGGANVPELARGELTVKQVYDMMMSGQLNGKSVGYGRGSRATGKYQFMPGTLSDIVRSGAISWDEKFTPSAQDKAILARISSYRGVTPELLKREGLSAKVSNMLAPEFASFPTYSGKSFYGQPVKSLSSIQNAYNSVVKAQKGGIPSKIGPNGDYVLPKQSPTDTKSIEQYPSYTGSGSGKSQIAIQRVVIEKMIPIPMEGKSKSNFMIAGGVNRPDMSGAQS